MGTLFLEWKYAMQTHTPYLDTPYLIPIHISSFRLLYIFEGNLFCFCLGPYPEVLRTCFWLWDQGSLLVGIREPHEVWGTKLGWAVYKASTLPALLSLQLWKKLKSSDILSLILQTDFSLVFWNCNGLPLIIF